VTTAATLIVKGKPPRLAERVLEVGTDLVANERITTSDTGRIQLLFRDGSTLGVGPNSDLVLDTYLYDPKAKAGKIAFSTAKGVFRFIGGRISKGTPVEFRTPVAVLGIRGGINQFSVGESGNTVNTTHIFGNETTITTPNAGGGTTVTTIARQEFQAVISGNAPIAIHRVSAAQFAGLNGFFERPPGVVALGLPAAPAGGSVVVAMPPLSPPPPVSLGLVTVPITLPTFDNSVVQRALPAPPPSPPPPPPAVVPAAPPPAMPPPKTF
jgi:hypothetical protein